MLERRLLGNVPWGMVALIISIALMGLSAVYSATYTAIGPSSLFTKQVIWICLGIIVMFAALVPDYHTVGRYAYVLYALSVLFLILVALVGKTGMGAQRWLPIGPFAFQPSELAKLSLVLALARYFAEEPRQGGYELRDLLVPGALLIVPLLLVMKQPDLGTALLLLFTASLIVILAGLRFKSVMAVVVLGAVLASSLLLVAPVRNKIWKSLKPYQQRRITAFLDPASDPLGSGYHATQAKIAVGSGQTTGKGFRRGTQSQMAFLPERHTDFIFPIIAEEWGFLRTGTVILFYLLVIALLGRVAWQTPDPFGRLLVGGVMTAFGFQGLLHMAISLRLAPITGLTLPLVSYGGSSLVSTFAGFGLVASVAMRCDSSCAEPRAEQ